MSEKKYNKKNANEYPFDELGDTKSSSFLKDMYAQYRKEGAFKKPLKNRARFNPSTPVVVSGIRG